MLILKVVISPSGVSTTAEVFSYVICMALTIFSGMTHEEPTCLFIFTESKAFLKSMKIMAASSWLFLISLMMRLRARICEYVDRIGV